MDNWLGFLLDGNAKLQVVRPSIDKAAQKLCILPLRERGGAWRAGACQGRWRKYVVIDNEVSVGR